MSVSAYPDKPNGAGRVAVYDGNTRFKSDAAARYQEFKQAAVDYIANLEQGDLRGLVEKPLDWRQGHPSYLTAMLQLLSALQAMHLPPGARIVEVGSGAGWATEILASLWYRVDCVEPSGEMIQVARRRVRDHLAHRGNAHFVKRVTWQHATMEEAVLERNAADAVIYFESFHHVVDEHAALDRTWDALRPGGQMVILGDSNWIPGNAEQEAAWSAEMAAFGTLESPFTADYLLWLLDRKGFTEVERRHLVNGLVPVSRESEPARSFALMDADWVNLVIARKPLGDHTSPSGEHPYGHPLDEEPPPVPRSGVRRRAAAGLRKLADLIAGRPEDARNALGE